MDRHRLGHLDPLAASGRSDRRWPRRRPRAPRRRRGHRPGRCRGRARSARAEPIWIRNSITARAPAATMSASSARCFAPRSGHCIGKFGQPRPAHQVDVLDLDVAGRPAGRFEQEIDPRVLAVLHLAPDRGVAGELRECGRPRSPRPRAHSGCAGVDADQLGAAAEIDLDQFPAMGELALRIVRLRQPHPRARRVEADHRARIGAMHGHRSRPTASTTSARKRL